MWGGPVWSIKTHVPGGVARYINSFYGTSKLFYHHSLSCPFLPSNLDIISALELADCVRYGRVSLSSCPTDWMNDGHVLIPSNKNRVIVFENCLDRPWDPPNGIRGPLFLSIKHRGVMLTTHLYPAPEVNVWSNTSTLSLRLHGVVLT